MTEGGHKDRRRPRRPRIKEAPHQLEKGSGDMLMAKRVDIFIARQAVLIAHAVKS